MPCAPQIVSRPRFCLHVRLLRSYECYLRASFALFPSNVPLHPLFHLPCFPQDAQPSTACPSRNIWLYPAEASPSPSTARRAHLECPACPRTEQAVNGAVAQSSGSQTTHGLQNSDAAGVPVSMVCESCFAKSPPRRKRAGWRNQLSGVGGIKGQDSAPRSVTFSPQ